MDQAAVVLELEDALLCADLARAAGLAVIYPVEQRDALFLGVLERVEQVRRDYPDEVQAAVLLVRAISTRDAGAAAAELGEPAAALIDQQVLTLSLADRIPTWIAEVVWHLGEEVVDRTDHRLVTIETLCADWGLHRPTAPGYLFALASALGAADAQGDGALAELLVADPGISGMIPSLLGAVGVGRVMATGSWASAIAEASAAGLIDRDTLLDLSLAQRANDRPEDLQFFVRLHEYLAPDNGEMSARTDAYQRLLGDHRAEVRTGVADGLYRRHDRAPLPTGLLVDITRVIFAQDESTFSSRHISWLRGAVARQPASAGRLAVAMIEAMNSADRSLVEQSLDAVAAMLDVADIDTVDAAQASLTRTVAALPSDVASIAAARLNLTLDHSVPERSGRHAAGRRPAPDTDGAWQRGTSFTVPTLPAPITSLAELTALAKEYLLDLDPIRGEFVLDGIAALAGADLAATRAALAPLTPTLEDVALAEQSQDPGAWLGERPVLAALARLALPETHSVHDHSWRTPAGPAGCLTLRTQEVLSRALAGQTQQLLATATEVWGGLDPQVFADRVAALAEAGQSGWPLDIEQALLRTHGTHFEPQVISTLAGVGTPLALRAERRLRQGVRSRPAVHVRLRGAQVRVQVGAGTEHDDDGPLTQQAFSLGDLAENPPGVALQVLLALPHHRELTAACLVQAMTQDSRPMLEDLRALSLLGAARGRTHDATALALLMGATLPHQSARPATTAALTRAAESGWFDVEGCAQLWRTAANSGDFDLAQVAETLATINGGPRTARLICHLASAVAEAAERLAEQSDSSTSSAAGDAHDDALAVRLRDIETTAATVSGVVVAQRRHSADGMLARRTEGAGAPDARLSVTGA